MRAPSFRVPTQNVEAYSLYLQGRHHHQKHTVAGYLKALDYYREALACQPDYAQAQASVASVYVAQGSDIGWVVPTEVMPKAKTAAQAALAMDDRVALAHGALAEVLHFYDWEWEAAEQEYRLALDLNAGLPDPHTAFAVFFGLDPLSWTLTERRLRCPRWRQQRMAGDHAGSLTTSSRRARYD